MTREPVGSVAEEAAKLFAVLQQAAAEAKHGDQSWRTHASRPSQYEDLGATTSRPAPTGPAGSATHPGSEPSSDSAPGSTPDPETAHGLGGAADSDPLSGPGSGFEAESGSPEHQHELGPDCVWCPVCQLISKVRHTSPETIEHLASTAAGVLGSVRTLLEAAAEAARQARIDADEREAAKGQPAEEDQPARSRVDRIDVSEDPEPWD